MGTGDARFTVDETCDFLYINLAPPNAGTGTLLAPCLGRDGLRTEWG